MALRFLTANESVHIPKLATHRLFNPGGRPLHLIEVQCGGYLGEDDIVRIEDDYGRTVSDRHGGGRMGGFDDPVVLSLIPRSLWIGLFGFGLVIHMTMLVLPIYSLQIFDRSWDQEAWKPWLC